MFLRPLSDGNGALLWDSCRGRVIKSRDIRVVSEFAMSKEVGIVLPSSTVPSPPAEPTEVVMPLKPCEPDSAPSSASEVPRTPPEVPRDETLPLPATPVAPPLERAPLSPSGIPDGEPVSMPRRSARVPRPVDRLGEWSKSAVSVPKAGVPLDEPRSFKQLLKSSHRQAWLRAADEEYASLLGKGTWTLVPRPAKRRIVRCKWVFRVKRKADGSLSKRKARLVAMGFTQQKGIDYSEVFAPTTRLETLRLLLSILGTRNWAGRQLDVKSAFLNSTLEKPVFMDQPEGYVDPSNPTWVLRLNKAIYGLKQSPRLWNKELHGALVSIGLTQSTLDPTLYLSFRSGKLQGALTVHVDDMCVIGCNEFVNNTCESISSRFEISSNEELKYFLSMEITRDMASRKVFLGQSRYIKDLVQTYLDGSFTPCATPTAKSFKDLRPRTANDASTDKPFANLVGALLWVAQCTRPDVSFAIARLSQFLRDPSPCHWEAAVRVLRYLASTSELRLSLGGPDLGANGFTDADWAEDRVDRRSTSAYAYLVGCGPISWRSRKQPTVSLSSTEAEYKSLSDACREAIWIRSLLAEMKLRPAAALPLHIDNSGAEALAQNPSHHARTKHIHTRYHFVRECLASNLVSVHHVASKDMAADLLTKPLEKTMLVRARTMLGIV